MSREHDARRFAEFCGAWAGEEQVGTEHRATATFETGIGADGRCLVTEYRRAYASDKPPFAATVLIYWSERYRCYERTWFDNRNGEPTVAQGRFGPFGFLFCEYDRAQGERRFTQLIREDGSLEFKMQVSGDGLAWTPVVSGLYRRVS